MGKPGKKPKQVSLKTRQGELPSWAMNERKPRSCQDNPGKYLHLGKACEGVRVTVVLSKWQTRKCSVWQKAGRMLEQEPAFVKRCEKTVQNS